MSTYTKAVHIKCKHCFTFFKISTYIDILLKVHVKIYMCKYCEIDTCDDNMYVYRYISVLIVYIYIIWQTCCIVHLFGFAKGLKLHHMTSFCYISYC